MFFLKSAESHCLLIIIFMITWNLNDPCFDRKGPCFGGLTFKDRGRCVYIEREREREREWLSNKKTHLRRTKTQ